MKKKLTTSLAVGLTALGIAGTAAAGTVTVDYLAGTTNTTTALTGYTTTGAMMDGMSVTAYFAGGDSQTLAWADLSSTGGGVSGNGWSLNQYGDTFTQRWTLSAFDASINKIVIDAGPGDSVFDTTFKGDIDGTPGSNRGQNFALTSPSTNRWNIVATYSDQVALAGADPFGDLFRYLTIDFGSDNSFANYILNGQNTPATLNFLADTDNLKFAGDIAPVPAPATVLLMGAGLAGLIGIRRRKQK